jgi:hypothetical protein
MRATGSLFSLFLIPQTSPSRPSYDLRNHDSSPHPGPMTYEETARDVLHFLRSHSLFGQGGSQLRVFPSPLPLPTRAGILISYLGVLRSRFRPNRSVVDRPGSESGATYEGTPATDTAISDGEGLHSSSSSSGLCWNRLDAALLLLGLDLTLLLLLRSPGEMENNRMSTRTSTGRKRLRIPSAARARDKMFSCAEGSRL